MCFIENACCCCTRSNPKQNIYRWSIVDMVLNVWFLLCTFAVAKNAELIGFCIAVIILDLVLLAATYYRKRKLVLFWQICLGIYILILILGCVVAMPLLLALTPEIDPTPNVTSTTNANSSTTSTSTSTTITTTTTTAAPVQTTTKRSKARGTGGGSGVFNLMIGLKPPENYIVFMVLLFLMSVYHIYFWLMVNHLRKEFVLHPIEEKVEPEELPPTMVVVSPQENEF